MAIFQLDGEKSLNTSVSHLAEVHEALRPYAVAARDAIVAEYARHAVTGQAAASWGLEEGIVDWSIVSDDPNILSKEYGRLWAPEMGGEGPVHTRGVHALAKVLGEFGA